MSNIDCPSPQKLSAFLLGDLPETELSEVAEHVSGCAACEEQASRLDSASDEIVECLRRLPNRDPEIPPADTDPSSSWEMPAFPAGTESWGEFRIVREIGRGGMGVVCEAYQGSLNRHVALKLLPALGDLPRFRREARAAGRLHHTNIVPVFGVGEYQGRSYYVMQYIAGRSLDQVLRDRAGQSFSRQGLGDRETARLGAQVADALAYAHAQGVIHRDIKPSNLLLDEHGTVWVTDFGLAHDASDTMTLTHTGDFLGTLRYVAPERITGKADERADFYGVGITLYELACGRPAYPEGDRAALMHQLLHHDPPSPRQLEPKIARDLETIILKAMARDQGTRYATATALAEDLRRFMDDRTILARRASLPERVARWSRRNKVVAGLLGTLLFVFVAGFAGVSALYLRADAEAVRADATAKRETDLRRTEQTLRLASQAELADREFKDGVELAKSGKVDFGLLQMVHALEMTPPGRPELERAIRTSLASWESQVLKRRAVLEFNPAGTPEDHFNGSLNALFSPDGRFILTTSSHDKIDKLWEASTGQIQGTLGAHRERGGPGSISSTGRLFATGQSDIRVGETSTGRLVLPVIDNNRQEARSLFFSPDERVFVVAWKDARSEAWDLLSHRRIEAPPILDGGIVAGFADDGERLVVIDGDRRSARLWRPLTGEISLLPIVTGILRVVQTSIDLEIGSQTLCRYLVSQNAGVGRLWQLAPTRMVAEFALPADTTELMLSPDERVLLLKRSPGEKFIPSNSSGGGSRIRLVDCTNGRQIGREIRLMSEAIAGAFAPDGRYFVTGGKDGLAQIFETATCRQFGSDLRHAHSVVRAAFSPDGRLILTTCWDATATIWEFTGEDFVAAEPSNGDESFATEDPWPGRAGLENKPWRWDTDSGDAIAPVGDRAACRRDGLFRLLETGSGQPIGRPIVGRWPIFTRIGFSPDGRRVAIAAVDIPDGPDRSVWSTLQIRDTTTGRPVSPLLPHINWPARAVFSPDGKTLAVGDYGRYVSLWDVETGRLLGGRRLRVGGIALHVAFSPNGRFIAAGTAEPGHQAIMWDRETLKVVSKPSQFAKPVRSIAFSPDSTSLAVSAGDGTIRVISTLDGQVRSEARLNESHLAFTLDSRYMLTAGNYLKSGARLWNTENWNPASPLMTQEARVYWSAALSPTGTAFLLMDGAQPVRLWELGSFHRIGPGRALRGPLFAARFNEDGTSFSAMDSRGNTGTWPVPLPLEEPIERLAARISERTGYELDSDGQPRRIELARWRQLRESQSKPTETSDESRVTLWHDRSARDAEALGDGFGARWHLDRLIAAQPRDGLQHARRARAWLQSNQVAAAEADLSQAIDLGPRDRVLDWMLHRAIDFRYERRPDDALRLLDRAAAERPGDWLTYALRALVHADRGDSAARESDVERALDREAEAQYVLLIGEERARAGRWAEAARLFDRAIALGEVPYEVWMQAATAHLEIDDEPGYRRVCTTLLERQPRTIHEPFIAATLAEVTTFAPGGTGGGDKASDWTSDLAKATSDARTRRYFLQVKAGVLHRMGRHDEAIALLEEAIAIGKGAPQPSESLFLALALEQTGDHAKARASLAKDRGEEPPIEDRGDWWSARGRRLLRREAAQAILDRDMPGNPFAP